MDAFNKPNIPIGFESIDYNSLKNACIKTAYVHREKLYCLKCNSEIIKLNQHRERNYCDKKETIYTMGICRNNHMMGIGNEILYSDHMLKWDGDKWTKK
jgi:hypothetical protein